MSTGFKGDGGERSCCELINYLIDNQCCSGYPEQARIIGSAGVFGEVPIFLVLKPRSMAVEKGELRAAVVQVGVYIVLLGDSGEFAIVEEPDDTKWLTDGGESDLIARAGPVYMLVETIVEKVVSVAAPGIGGANPERTAWIDLVIDTPGHFAIGRNFEHSRQIDVPAFIDRGAIGCAVLGQEIIIIHGEQLCGETPLF